MPPQCSGGGSWREKEKEVGIERERGKGKTKLVCSSRLQWTAAAAAAEAEAASSVPVAICRSCHLTLLATSWNIQQASCAQVPPNGCSCPLPPSFRTTARFSFVPHLICIFICLIYKWRTAKLRQGGRMWQADSTELSCAELKALWNCHTNCQYWLWLSPPSLPCPSFYSSLAASLSCCANFMCGQVSAIIGDSFSFMWISFKCPRIKTPERDSRDSKERKREGECEVDSAIEGVSFCLLFKWFPSTRPATLWLLFEVCHVCPHLSRGREHSTERGKREKEGREWGVGHSGKAGPGQFMRDFVSELTTQFAKR